MAGEGGRMDGRRTPLKIKWTGSFTMPADPMPGGDYVAEFTTFLVEDAPGGSVITAEFTASEKTAPTPRTPTEPGWYWWRYPGAKWEACEVCHSCRDEPSTRLVQRRASGWIDQAYELDKCEWGPRIFAPDDTESTT